jgi:hypothetical protein
LPRYIVVVDEVDDERVGESAVEAMRLTQRVELEKNLGKYTREQGFPVSDETIACRIWKDCKWLGAPRTVVEQAQGSKVLRVVSHWVENRTALTLAR